MAYQTGTASSPQNLLQLLSTFLLAQGYTINRQDNDGTYERLSISKNGDFFNFYANATEIFLTLSSGYADVAKGLQADETSSIIGQAGCSTNAIAAGTFTAYHFFFDADYMHVVIESSSNLFNHFTFGLITKFGTYTGGAHIDVVYWSQLATNIDVPGDPDHYSLAGGYNNGTPDRSSYLRYDKTAANQYYKGSKSDGALTLRGTSVRPPSSQSFGAEGIILFNTPTSLTGRAISTPLMLLAGDASSSYEPMGYLPFTREIMIDFLNANDVVDTDWFVFPIRAKRDPDIRDDADNSGLLGYAIKKVL